MVVNIKVSTKHFSQFPVQTKCVFQKCFQKFSSIHKRPVWSMHANITFVTCQHHTTAKDKFIHVLQEHYNTKRTA